jgi:hypothetical protein
MDCQPTICNSSFETGFVFYRTAIVLQERRVDKLNMDTAILHRLDGVGDLDQLAGDWSGSDNGRSDVSCMAWMAYP